MARQKLNQGAFPTGAGGDNWRTGSAKLDEGIGELYNQFGADDQGVLPSALPINKGGTGATTEEEVRLNLDVFSKTEVAQAIEAAIIPPDPEGTVTKAYVDSAALKAEDNAKSAAAQDASTKANNALSSSKTYTDQQIGNIGTTQINKGGTGATNATSARTNLDVYSKAEVAQAISNAKLPDAGATPISKGGTGATTAAGARTNLDVPSKGDLQKATTTANAANKTAGEAKLSANNATKAVANKQDKLIAGDNIKITGNVISSDGGGATLGANEFFGNQYISGDLEVTGAVAIDIKPLLNATGTAPLYVCRAWATFSGSANPSIIGGGNISSVTRGSAGVYRLYFLTPMLTNKYAVFVSADARTAGNIGYFPSLASIGQSQDSFSIQLMPSTGASRVDGYDFNVLIMTE